MTQTNFKYANQILKGIMSHLPSSDDQDLNKESNKWSMYSGAKCHTDTEKCCQNLKTSGN